MTSERLQARGIAAHILKHGGEDSDYEILARQYQTAERRLEILLSLFATAIALLSDLCAGLPCQELPTVKRMRDDIEKLRAAVSTETDLSKGTDPNGRN